MAQQRRQEKTGQRQRHAGDEEETKVQQERVFEEEIKLKQAPRPAQQQHLNHIQASVGDQPGGPIRTALQPHLFHRFPQPQFLFGDQVGQLQNEIKHKGREQKHVPILLHRVPFKGQIRVGKWFHGNVVVVVVILI